MIHIAGYDSPIGRLLLAEREGALTDLWMEGCRFSQTFSECDVREQTNHPILIQTVHWLERYFSGQMPSVSELRLAPEGNEFRKEVWELLCEIPYGKVMTYGEIARKIAAKHGLLRMSAQAVGGAIGHNPIPIIIPCHRVVGADGGLTGYSCGIEKKIALLRIEGHSVEGSRIIKKP